VVVLVLDVEPVVLVLPELESSLEVLVAEVVPAVDVELSAVAELVLVVPVVVLVVVPVVDEWA
jgi:hypothetical protein